ncbi:MAG: efflux RND transporter periplasmic adaptor subunit [Armatimonadetes bacterium]|nr:efflux RND transporter periplasmic adaptor subunit [Armatimonadota bacterium]
MAQSITLVRRHWLSVLTLLILISSVVMVSWIVKTKRPAGAMTIIEAQGMDMTAMKPPPGVQPVAVEAAALRSLAGTEVFPGTVQAYSDEDVVVRIPGRVVDMLVYPGDEVKAGQLLARLEADEFALQQAEAGLKAGAADALVLVGELEVERLRANLRRCEADVGTMLAAAERMRAQRSAKRTHLEHNREETAAKEAVVSERQAELRYAEQDLKREQSLYQAGAISLDELQVAETRRDAAIARVDRAEAEARAMGHNATAIEQEVVAAERAVEEADSRLAATRETVTEAEGQIAKAQADVAAKRSQAKAAGSGAGSASTMAGYRNLRALDDGVVTERLVSPGSLVMPGRVLLRLKVIKKVRIQTQVPERLADRVRPGTAVEITAGEIVRQAEITSVFQAIDPKTRTFTAEALVDNPDKAFLPGMYVEVTVTTAGAEQVLAVRNSAIKEAADGSRFVWVMVEREDDAAAITDWTCTMHPDVSEPGEGDCPICKMPLVPQSRTGRFFASRRQVTLGPTNGRYTAILSGVDLGDQVIWAGNDDLDEEAPVQAVEWGRTGPKELPSGTGTTTHEGMEMPGGTQMEGAEDSAKEDDAIRSEAAAKFPPGTDLWTCTMDPEVVADAPGSCPVCNMDLVPYRPAEVDGSAG